MNAASTSYDLGRSGPDHSLPGVQGGDAGFVDPAFFHRRERDAVPIALDREGEDVRWVAANSRKVGDDDRVVTAASEVAGQLTQDRAWPMPAGQADLKIDRRPRPAALARGGQDCLQLVLYMRVPGVSGTDNADVGRRAFGQRHGATSYLFPGALNPFFDGAAEPLIGLAAGG